MELTESQKVAQTILDAYKAVAFAEDWNIAQCNQPLYKLQRKALIAAIRLAYDMTELKAWRVYDVWVDCMESLNYCANYVLTHPRDNVYSR